MAGGEDLGVLPFASVMSTDLVEAAPDATFSDAAQLMADRQVHHLLVSDGGAGRAWSTWTWSGRS